MLYFLQEIKSTRQHASDVQQRDWGALVAYTVLIGKHFSPRIAQRFLKVVIGGAQEGTKMFRLSLQMVEPLET